MNNNFKLNIKKRRFSKYILLHLVLIIYSFVGIFSKIASSQEIFSVKFWFLYGAILIILFLYAILWQKILKSVPLTIAFANKAIIVIWGIIWGHLFFNESISINNIAGGALIILGIVLVVNSD